VVEVEAWRRDAAAAAATATGKRERASAPKELKDSIILADFVNQTGDPVFDTTLNQALQIDLEQSPVINIVSQEHLRQSVKYLGKPEDTPVTPAIAREIGEREGMKAILTGTIANLGKEYVITLTAQNTATGDEIVERAGDRLRTRSMCWRAWQRRRRRCGASWARTWRASRSWTRRLARRRRLRWRRFAPMRWAIRRTRRRWTFPRRRVTTNGPSSSTQLCHGVCAAGSGVHQFGPGGEGEQVFCQGLRALKACERARAALHLRPLRPERDRQPAEGD
jgi:hypothetical protein